MTRPSPPLLPGPTKIATFLPCGSPYLSSIISTVLRPAFSINSSEGILKVLIAALSRPRICSAVTNFMFLFFLVLPLCCIFLLDPDMCLQQTYFSEFKMRFCCVQINVFVKPVVPHYDGIYLPCWQC